MLCYNILYFLLFFAGTLGNTPKDPPHGERIICTTRSHSTKAVVQAVDDCEPTHKLKVGGAGHKVRYATAKQLASVCYGLHFLSNRCCWS